MTEMKRPKRPKSTHVYISDLAAEYEVRLQKIADIIEACEERQGDETPSPMEIKQIYRLAKGEK